MSVIANQIGSSALAGFGLKWKRLQLVGMLFVMPVVLGTLVFNIVPTLGTLGISFTTMIC